jgi:GPI-anchor transamidase subunit GAA1
MRTKSNLLERLHASFFFYIFTAHDRFMKIGKFLPSAVLISVAMMFGGLRSWVDAGWVITSTEKGPTSESRNRPVMQALGIMLLTHLGGIGMYKWGASGVGVLFRLINVYKAHHIL